MGKAGRLLSVVIASEAKQSRAKKKVWIASAQGRLAMTVEFVQVARVSVSDTRDKG
jgi:hypothetical protein